MKNFTQIGNKKIMDSNLSDGAFRTYLAILMRRFVNNNPFPSLKTISKDRGKSIKTISKHLKELRYKGYIISKRRGFNMTNEYEFPIEEKRELSIRKESSYQYGRKVPYNNTKFNNTKINNSFRYNPIGIQSLNEIFNGESKS